MEKSQELICGCSAWPENANFLADFCPYYQIGSIHAPKRTYLRTKIVNTSI